MEPLVRYAIPGVIIAAGLGAVILCFLALRVFNRDGQESEHYSQSRLFFMRMGHALAACCFAIAAVLAGVAFRGPAAPTAPAPESVIPPPEITERLELTGMLAAKGAGLRALA